MKVAELIAALQLLPPNSECIMQADSEGNGYRKLEGVDGDAVYVAEDSWSGEVYRASDSADDVGMTTREWNKLKKGSRCAVLFPAN